MKLFPLFFLLISLVSCSTFKEEDPHSGDLEKGVKIAVVNFQVEGGNSLAQHMARINNLAEKASQMNATYLILPELTSFDLLPVNPLEKSTYEELLKLSEMASPYVKSLKEISRRHRINLIGASAVIKEGSHFLNRAFFIDTKGKTQYQDKLRPTPWEAKYKFEGRRKVKLFKTPDFSFVILICHDAEFPDISSSLTKLAPEVILVPSMTDDEFGLNRVKITSAARAIEHMAYVFMTGTSAKESAPWHSYLGRNYFFTPKNKYFQNMKTNPSSKEETLSFFTLDLEKLRAARKDLKQIYPGRDAI